MKDNDIVYDNPQDPEFERKLMEYAGVKTNADQEDALRDYTQLIHTQIVFDECLKELWLGNFAINRQLGEAEAERFYQLIDESQIKQIMKDATEKARKKILMKMEGTE